MLSEYLREEGEGGWTPDPYQPDPYVAGPMGSPVAPSSGPTPTGPVPDVGVGGGGGGVEFPSYGMAPYGGASSPAPVYNPADPFNAPEFQAPDWQAVMADPGYQFRLKQGLDAMNASAAAKGILHTGGTLRDLMDYGENSASQEFANAYDRAERAHEMNYRGEYDEWAARNGIARDVYQSQYDPWALQTGQDFGAWDAWIRAQLARQGLMNEAAFGAMGG